ncbi:MAG: hypothetical protein R3C03_24160 [Pirellulaceae bacterium]
MFRYLWKAFSEAFPKVPQSARTVSGATLAVDLGVDLANREKFATLISHVA